MHLMLRREHHEVLDQALVCSVAWTVASWTFQRRLPSSLKTMVEWRVPSPNVTLSSSQVCWLARYSSHHRLEYSYHDFLDQWEWGYNLAFTLPLHRITLHLIMGVNFASSRSYSATQCVLLTGLLYPRVIELTANPFETGSWSTDWYNKIIFWRHCIIM